MSIKIEKLHIKETVSFAITNIPHVDKTTLEKLIELVYTNGNYGTISDEQLVSKMRLTLKYIPEACMDSLFVLADLLEIPMRPELYQLELSPYISIHLRPTVTTNVLNYAQRPQSTL